MITKHIFALLLPAMLFTGCGEPSSSPDESGETSEDQVTQIADEYVDAFLAAQPEYATLFGAAGADHSAIHDASPEAIAAWEAREDEWLTRLEQIDASALDGQPEWVLHGFLLETLQSSQQIRTCKRDLWTVDQLGGWQVTYPMIAGVQPLGTDLAREDALTRFGSLPRYIETEIENLREGIRQGYLSPRLAVERVLDQLDALAGASAEDSPFFVLAGRDSSQSFKSAVTRVIADSIQPATIRYRDFLRDEYLPAARSEIAVAANRDGSDCYRALLRDETTLNMTPEEIHELGLETMKVIRSEMREIGLKTFGTEDVTELLEKLRTEPEYRFDTADEIKQTAEEAIARAKIEMPLWFGLVPEADVVVEPIPKFEEDSAPVGMYLPPAEDGSRPGTYRINLGSPEEKPIAPHEAIAFHEGIPGHHLQIAIAQERTSSHRLMRYLFMTAFVEGWALYSERLSDEMGLYSSELSRMGMLSTLAFRAARLVVDTGMHALGWSRQQAIDYMAENTLEGISDIEVEIDRYIVWPGQATAYMVGNLEIWRLRRLAEERLGPDFDIREFHDVVLGNGALTLPMLEYQVEHWIDRKAG
jgi:uncharacterized protein (DUF885 family)